MEIFKEQYERVESKGNSESKRDFRIRICKDDRSIKGTLLFHHQGC